MGQALRAIGETGSKRQDGHKGGIRQKYILDDADRNLIRAVYANPEYGSVSDSVEYLMAHFNAPRTTVHGWATRMGLARTRDNYWTPEEIACLQEYYQKPSGKRASIKSIAKHLGRSEASVRIKAKRMKFHRVMGDAYTANSLADALGCDRHKVLRWIDRGWLTASREKSREDERYCIRPEDIRQFIIAHPSEIDHRRSDWYWLLDILVGPEDIGKLKIKKGQK